VIKNVREYSRDDCYTYVGKVIDLGSEAESMHPWQLAMQIIMLVVLILMAI